MRPWIAVVVAVSCGAPAFGAPPERTGGRLLDALRVGDRVAVRTEGKGVPAGTAWIRVVSDDAEAAELFPTQEERKEYDSLKDEALTRPSLPPRATDEERRVYNEKSEELRKTMARRSELSLKVAVEGGWVTAVGADYVAVQTEAGPTDRWPVRQIARLTERNGGPAAPGASPPSLPSEGRTTPRLLDALHVGDEVVLQSTSAGPVNVFVGMKDDLKDRIATAEERQEYADLGDVPGYEPLPLPAINGGREGLDAMRRTLEERREKQERIRKLRPRVEYEAVRLTAVGDDFIAFETGGVTVYLPLHRIGLVHVKPAAAGSPPPKAE